MLDLLGREALGLGEDRNRWPIEIRQNVDRHSRDQECSEAGQQNCNSNDQGPLSEALRNKQLEHEERPSSADLRQCLGTVNHDAIARRDPTGHEHLSAVEWLHTDLACDEPLRLDLVPHDRLAGRSAHDCITW